MKKLQVDSIRKIFNNQLLLSDVFLTCEQGEVVGLIGRNGCGKSTLLKIIFGVEYAENKHIRIDTKVLRNVSDSRNLINYLPQQNFLPSNVTVKNLIRLFLPKKSRMQLYENDLLSALLNKKFHILSGGEKRILEILLLLYSEAEFILLDEPFEGLSPLTRDIITEQIFIMRRTKGIIVTDHDYENVMGMSDKILFLQNGFLKEISNKKELLEHGYLVRPDRI